jgi:hypothetical protein
MGFGGEWLSPVKEDFLTVRCQFLTQRVLCIMIALIAAGEMIQFEIPPYFSRG